MDLREGSAIQLVGLRKDVTLNGRVGVVICRTGVNDPRPRSPRALA
jgi:hypothetical protein